MQPILAIIAILIGYLLGSFLPAYFIAKAKGFDIRKKGSGNPGTVNAAAQMGYGIAAIVAIYDVAKPIIAITIAKAIGVSVVIAIAAGFAAIVGHLAPFYLRFKGGRGVASAMGIVLYSLFILIKLNWHFVYPLIIIGICALTIALLKKGKSRSNLLTFTTMPLFILATLLFHTINPYSIALFVASLFIVCERIEKPLRKLFKKMTKLEKSLIKRKILRPAAAVFPILILLTDKKIVLTIVALPFIYFIAMEIIHFIKPRFKYFLIKYKKTEKRRISSMTLFLFSTALTILVFNKYIAALALLFVIFGDLAAWTIGKSFGKIKLLDKTLEGTIACFIVCALIAILFFKIFHFNIVVGLVGSIVASLVELSPIQDDNLAIPLTSAIVMTALTTLL